MIDLNELEAAINRFAFDGDVLGLSKAECSDLLTRLRQAEKDAARYRWLRESTHFDSMQHQLYCLHYGERLDIAIDEAMQCQQ